MAERSPWVMEVTDLAPCRVTNRGDYTLIFIYFAILLIICYEFPIPDYVMKNLSFIAEGLVWKIDCNIFKALILNYLCLQIYFFWMFFFA